MHVNGVHSGSALRSLPALQAAPPSLNQLFKKALQPAVDGEPRDFTAQEADATAYIDQRIAKLTQQIETDDNKSIWLNQRGAYYVQSGNLAAAEQDFSLVLVQEPSDYFANLSLGWLCQKRGAHAEALQHFGIALKSEPDAKYFISKHVGYTYYALNQMPRARKAFECARDAFPEDPDIRMGLLETYLKVDCLREGLNEARLLTSMPLYQVQGLLGAGLALLMMNRKREAINELEAVLRIKPNHFLAHYCLGACYRALDEYEMALPHFQEAFLVMPKKCEMLLAIAEGALLTKRMLLFDECVSSMKALPGKEQEVKSLEAMRLILHEQQYAAALRVLNKNRKCVYAMRYRAQAYFYLHKYSKAISEIRLYLEQTPYDYGMMRLLGNCYKAMSRHDEALQVFQNCMKYIDIGEAGQTDLLTPQDLAVQYECAALSWKLDKEHDALDLLDDLVRIDSEYQEAYLLRAEIFLRQGNREEAYLELDEARCIKPECPKTLEALFSYYKAADNLAEAERLCRQLLAQNSQNAKYKRWLADLLPKRDTPSTQRQKPTAVPSCPAYLPAVLPIAEEQESTRIARETYERRLAEQRVMLDQKQQRLETQRLQEQREKVQKAEEERALKEFQEMLDAKRDIERAIWKSALLAEKRELAEQRKDAEDMTPPDPLANPLAKIKCLTDLDELPEPSSTVQLIIHQPLPLKASPITAAAQRTLPPAKSPSPKIATRSPHELQLEQALQAITADRLTPLEVQRRAIKFKQLCQKSSHRHLIQGDPFLSHFLDMGQKIPTEAQIQTAISTVSLSIGCLRAIFSARTSNSGKSRFSFKWS